MRIISILLLLCSIHGWSQSYPLGLNPSNLEWKEINTREARIIFLEGGEDQAQRVANVIDRMARNESYRLGNKLKKIPIILHNQTLTSNGFVTVSPWRSEFYAFGPQNNFSGAVDWLDLLSIHEYRHVQQFQNANKGVTRLMGFLFGQNGWGGSTVMALPNWFLEGDAVFYETISTRAGRGRMPQFENQFKAMILADRKYTYEKARGNSFREFVPNHYGLGYFMTTSLRRKFGPEIWFKLVDESVRYKGIIYPLSKSMKRNTGYRTPQLFRETFDELEEEWVNEIESKTLTPSEFVVGEKKLGFTNYRNATFVNDSLVVFEKSGFKDIPTFYLLNLNSGHSKKLMEPGFYDRGNATISIEGSRVVWAENTFDLRWDNRDYSIIKSYDLESGDIRTHTKRTKYLAPDLHPDDKRIVAVNYREDGLQELHIVSLADGKVEQVIEHSERLKFAFPQWVENGLVVVGKKMDQNAIFHLSLDAGEWSQLTPYYPDQITYLKPRGGKIYFGGIFTGTDEVYVLDANTIYQVTSTDFGAVQPDVSPNGDRLLVSKYTVNGYELRSLELDNVVISPFEGQLTSSADYYEPLEPRPDILYGDDKVYPVSKYKGTFSVHSWSPSVSDISLDSQNPTIGGGIFFDNAISTLTGSLSMEYNLNERASTFGASTEFGKYFPVFGMSFAQSTRSRFIPVYREIRQDDGFLPVIQTLSQVWDESKVSLEVTLPFNLTRRNYFSRLWVTGAYEQIWVDYRDETLGANGSFGALRTNLSFSVLKRRAYQHVNPRLGIQSTLIARRTVGTSFNQSEYLQSSSFIFLPGIAKNHSLFFDVHFNSEPFLASYKFIDVFRYSRGYFASPHDQAQKYGVNYRLPLLYPDLSLGPVVFLKRIVGTVFADYSNIGTDSYDVREFTNITPVRASNRTVRTDEQFRSIGAEITFDFRFFRSVDPTIGFRFSRLLDATTQSANQFEFLLVSYGIDVN